MVRITCFSLVLSLYLTACSSSDPTTQGTVDIEVEVAFPNLEFELPLDLQSPRDGSNRLFVVEQPGRVYHFQNESTADSSVLFLDITARVHDDGWEEGLLGLAFHPDFAANGYLYVNYTAANPKRTVISRFSVLSTDPDVADPNSEFVILEYAQPFSNHNGGSLVFGPDGYLYVGVGDGGSANDPQGNGQNRQTLLGTILRIDVDNPAAGRNYGIPSDNPFAGNSEGYREEIYAYGLRNPWRFSFDKQTGTLWAADVGQNRLEEIDTIIAGGNYGWNIMEGSECPDGSACDTSGLVLPVAEYGRSLGQSITGGFVYRGSLVSSLVGQYVYADFMTGRIWSLATPGSPNPNPILRISSELSISSFGLDTDDELYFTAFDGKIYRFAEKR